MGRRLGSEILGELAGLGWLRRAGWWWVIVNHTVPRLIQHHGD